MKIRIEIAKNGQLPSQGRNRGSIPRGSADDIPHTEIPFPIPGLAKDFLQIGEFYRAWFDLDKDESEFVFFVGYLASNTGLILEDGNGDFHKFFFDEIEWS